MHLSLGIDRKRGAERPRHPLISEVRVYRAVPQKSSSGPLGPKLETALQMSFPGASGPSQIYSVHARGIVKLPPPPEQKTQA